MTTTESTMSLFRQVLLSVRVGSLFVVSDVRDQLDAAQITGPAVGTCVIKAQERGWIEGAGSERSVEPTAKGRRVVVWRRRPIGPQGMGQHKHEPDLLSLLVAS